MKEKLRLLILTLLCAAFGQAMAQEVILDFTTNDLWQFPEGSSNRGTAAATFSNGDYAITLEATSNGYYFSSYQGNNYLMLGKTDATLTLPAFNFDVATIEVVGNESASGNVKQNIFVGDEAICTETTGAKGTNKYDIPTEYQAAGTIYTLKILNNYNSQIRQINIYKAGQTVKDTPTIQFYNTSFTVILGEDFEAPSLTYSGDGAITYSSDAEDVATVDATTGAVDIVGVGTANITASAAETSTCNAVSTSYKITVIEPQSSHEIVDGIFDFTDVTDYGSGLQPSDSQEYITEDNTWTAGNVTLVTSGRYRWWFAANGNSLRFYNNVVEEVQTSKMTISVPEGYTISQIDMTGTGLAFTANVGEFADGKWTGNAQSVELTYSGLGTKQIKTITVTYGNGDTPVEKETPTMKFSGSSFTVTLGDDFTAPELTYSGDGTVTYASDNEEAVTVDSATGAVDIIGLGTAKITATATETANFYGATASYTINVVDQQGTHEVVDGTFDFSDNTDYGSGLTPSTEDYIYDDHTWTAGNVTLVTSGKYRWWFAAGGNTLRFYNNVENDVQTSKMTISVPEGYTISQIDLSGSSLAFTANVGVYDSNKWTGEAQSVELTYSGSGTKQIKTITVTYSNGSTPPVEKETPTMKFSGTYFTVILGDDFTAPELTYNGDGTVTYASDNEEAVTVDPTTGAVDIVGVGKAAITATATETDNFYGASASYTISVAEEQGTHEVVDGTFDFSDNTDYGSGLTPSAGDEYIYDDHTWTAGNVTLVTSGKYRWWLNASGNTLRFYNNVVDEVQTSKMTISVPDGYTISQIDFAGSGLVFTANVGEYGNNKWAGEAQSVELTYSGSGTKQIKTITVTYSNGSTPPVEKETPTMKFSGSFYTVILGDDFTAPELTYNGDGTVTYASDNEEAVTVDPTTGEVDIVGVGRAVITATATETDNFYGATASYTISVADDQGTHEVVDGTFDFSDNTDYGTGLEPSSSDEYIYDDYTWTAGNVTLVTSGKYRWWLNANGNTLRFYNNVVDDVQTSKMTISVPAGSTISKIEMVGSKVEFTANVGEFAEGIWTGEAQSVEFTYTGSGTKQIKTITVTYSNGDILLGDADGDGEVSIADVTKVVNYILTNETTGLIFENADVDGSGTLDINDISGIVAIILGN